MKITLLNFVFVLFLTIGALAQSSEILPGSVIPKMTTAQRTGIASPQNGMLVFDSNTQSYWYRKSGTWSELVGNTNISGTENFLVKFGSTATGVNSLIYDDNEKIGIGTSIPSASSFVHINGVGNYNLGGGHYYHANALNVTTPLTGGVHSGIYGHGAWRGIIGHNSGNTIRTEGIGVLGIVSEASGLSSAYGVKGEVKNSVASSQAYGVHGSVDITSTFNNTGVYGKASGGQSNNYGVYGTATGTGSYAGYFSGRLHVTGSLSKGSGTFKIDHPLDPENKYLYHSFIESPDMMNIYNGNITTDAQGYGTVVLPGYFEALNKDFRYQLTVIGTFAQAIIKEKIKDNQFVIQTNSPNVEVSWQVTGIRKDKYAEANRVVPEVDKEASEKGSYLHPEAWGKPQSKGLNFEYDKEKSTFNNVRN